MSNMNEIVKTLQDAVTRQTNQAKPTAYDTPAVVRRVEGDTAWVHIPDGVDETPVKLTIAAKEGDQVQVRVSGGSAFMVGNGTAPPTDDAKAKQAYTIATVAEGAAENALANANLAKEAADTARGEAIRAGEAADRAEGKADDAAEAATSAQQSADSALVNLSTVQDVVGVLNWITAHGTMTLTSDVTVNPAHVYFVVDAGGDYVVGGTHYSIVSEPKDADIGTYYELTVDESVQNYVATHIVVDSEGLWIVPDSGGNKVLIATGSGSTYTRAGTYIIGQHNGSDVKIASFATNGYSFYNSDGSKMLMRVGFSSSSGWFTFGSRASGSVNSINSFCSGEENKAESSNASAIGYGNSVGSSGSHADGKYNVIDDLSEAAHVDGYENYIYRARGAHAEGFENAVGDSTDTAATPQKLGAHVEGNQNKVVSGSGAHAEGKGTSAKGEGAHSEGYYTTADGQGAHAEGCNSAAGGSGAHAEGWSTSNGEYAHSQNFHTTASSDYQTALGKYNVTDISDTYACIIGNGTADNARSNALTVDWSGNVTAAGGADLAAMTESSGTYSGGLNDEALLTSATITKLTTWLNS